MRIAEDNDNRYLPTTEIILQHDTVFFETRPTTRDETQEERNSLILVYPYRVYNITPASRNRLIRLMDALQARRTHAVYPHEYTIFPETHYLL